MLIRHRVAVTSIVGALTLGLASAAIAADTVTQGVTPGDRTASIADLTLSQITYSHAEQTSPGTMTLSVEDVTGSDEGWNVTVQSSDFVYTGDQGGQDIPATHFALTDASNPGLVGGQPIDQTAGPKVPAEQPAHTSLAEPRKVLQADVGSGQGSYTQDLGVELTIPAMSRVGTYTGTLTTTITPARDR